jgi:hypothetical protein
MEAKEAAHYKEQKAFQEKLKEQRAKAQKLQEEKAKREQDLLNAKQQFSSMEEELRATKEMAKK